MGELPSGTVTFLFTDIEGSTRLLHELGDRYAEVLAEHRRVLREVFGAHGGVEVDTQGDAFFYAFARASDALAGAKAGQRALDGGPVRVRMGLHTGEPTVTDEGYVGVDVHLAARVMGAGHGGQVLVSAAAAAAADGATLRDLGEHRLKDIDRPVALFQLGGGSFPPLKTIANTNLPRPASSFVGREREVGEVEALLRTARLVTLTGPGGSGKTRLAIEAAARLVGETLHGVFWVGLAPIRDADLVLPAVAQTLGAHDDLAAHVGDRDLLLLLDNLEQVVDVAPLLATLVEVCPNLSLLVTSRELLRVRGEVEYAVLPLADPDGVALFCERAQLPASPAAEELCRRLDNMPLALELAAARTPLLSPEEILERLSQRLDLLRGGRDADPRQQTLRATIAWSHDLLDQDERQLFARLAVFAGGCTPPAAEIVCDADLDTLQSLVAKSLIRRTDGRLWMLETIREFALEQVADSGESGDVRRRHAEHYRTMAESANLSLDAIGQGGQRHDLVLPEQDNLRAAMDWAADADVELGLRLGVALENFWITHDPSEGLRRFEALLARSEDVDPALRARAFRDYGGCADVMGDVERARAAYERSRELARQAGDERATAEAVFRIGVTAWIRGDLDEARRLHEESLAMFRRLEHRIGELQALGNLGWFEVEHGDRETGLAMVAEADRMAVEAGWVWWHAQMLGSHTELAFDDGRFDEVEQHAREVLRLGVEMDDERQVLFALAMLAAAAATQGQPERAARLLAAVEAQDVGAGRFWVFDRERVAAHVGHFHGPVEVPSLDEAVAEGLAGA